MANAMGREDAILPPCRSITSTLGLAGSLDRDRTSFGKTQELAILQSVLFFIEWVGCHC